MIVYISAKGVYKHILHLLLVAAAFFHHVQTKNLYHFDTMQDNILDIEFAVLKTHNHI